MSREPQNITLAPIVITGLSNTLCFTSLNDLLQYFSSNAFAAVPGTISNVTIGNVQPNATQRSNQWDFVNSDGNFQYIAFFDGTTWEQVLPAPQAVIWMYGAPDSNTIPPGFTLIDDNNAKVTSDQAAHIGSFYGPTPGTPPYTYFAVTWDSF